MFTRDANGEIDRRDLVNELLLWVKEEQTKDNPKRGILLCEGNESSIDTVIYSLVFPYFLVIPVGGCTNVCKSLSTVRRRLAPFNMYVFGIIDRDGLSKAEIRANYYKNGVLVTKLPFIENIICVPEMIKIVCKYKGLNYATVLRQVKDELMKSLWKKFKETLPLNLGIDKDEKILELSISASTKKKSISKQITSDNILYSYRDKVVASVIAAHVGLNGRKEYYALVTEMLQYDEYKNEVLRVVSKYIPYIDLGIFKSYIFAK